MGIYIFLVILALVLPPLSKNILSLKRKQREFAVFTYMFLLYIVFVFRDINVGIDMPGYEKIYISANDYDFFVHDWIYMETGYVFLMKFFNFIGFSFRGFLMIMYLIFVIPLGKYIYKNSKDLQLSFIIFLCFQFFAFSMSGLRQTIASGICLWAFTIAQKNGIQSFLKYCLLVYLATTIHQSAMVFFPAYFMMRYKLNVKLFLLYIVLFIFIYFYRDLLIGYINSDQDNHFVYQQALEVGPVFVFVTLVCIASMFYSNRDTDANNYFKLKDIFSLQEQDIVLSLGNHANLLVMSVMIMWLFTGSMVMRSANYYQIMLVVVIPYLLEFMAIDIKLVIKFLIIVFMVFFFVVFELIPGVMNIVPYEFASSISIFK